MFSQGGQDRWVCEMLNNKRDGYFIDIGACDGKTFSNTFHLEKELGWTGVCVEPAKKQFKKLKKNRDCVCVNKAMYGEDGVVRFMEYRNNQFRGNITDVKYDETGFQYEIGAITFETLIREYEVPDVIDYISLDVEGLEWEILKTFPFDRCISRLWTIEYNDNRDKIIDLMTKNEYSYMPDRMKEAWWEDWFYYG